MASSANESFWIDHDLASKAMVGRTHRLATRVKGNQRQPTPLAEAARAGGAHPGLAPLFQVGEERPCSLERGLVGGAAPCRDNQVKVGVRGRRT